MSRRQRKKTNARKAEKNGTAAKRKGLWRKVLLGVVVIMLGLCVYAYKSVITYLHSNEFREAVAKQVGAEIGSDVSFGDFKWKGLSARNDRFESKGAGAFVMTEAKDLFLDVELDFLKRDKFRLKNVTIGSLATELDLSKEFLKFDKIKREKTFLESLLPDKVELIDAEILDASATVRGRYGDYSFSGSKINFVKRESGYAALLEGGMMKLPFPFLSIARLEKGELVQLDEEIYIKDTQFRIFKSGVVTLNGVVDFSTSASKLYDVKGELSGLHCYDVFPNSWHRHLTGEVLGSFRIQPDMAAEPKIQGELEIINGALQFLPVLEKISKYLDEPRYRTLNFENFRCDFEKYRDQYHLRNVILQSKELIMIEGDLEIKGDKLDGKFQVGMPPHYLEKIPGAKYNVFKPGKEDLYWTSVKIGGTIDEVSEDLTDRLIQAATEETLKRMLKMGEDVLSPETLGKIKGVGDTTTENLSKVLNGEKTAVEGATDVLQSALEGLTGSKENDVKEGNKQKGKKDGGLIPKLPGVSDLPLPF